LEALVGDGVTLGADYPRVVSWKIGEKIVSSKSDLILDSLSDYSDLTVQVSQPNDAAITLLVIANSP
jgi:hypothetical protein